MSFYRGRVRGGATYTTASSNDIDRGTPLSGYVNYEVLILHNIFKNVQLTHVLTNRLK